MSEQLFSTILLIDNNSNSATYPVHFLHNNPSIIITIFNCGNFYGTIFSIVYYEVNRLQHQYVCTGYTFLPKVWGSVKSVKRQSSQLLSESRGNERIWLQERPTIRHLGSMALALWRMAHCWDFYVWITGYQTPQTTDTAEVKGPVYVFGATTRCGCCFFSLFSLFSILIYFFSALLGSTELLVGWLAPEVAIWPSETTINIHAINNIDSNINIINIMIHIDSHTVELIYYPLEYYQ